MSSCKYLVIEYLLIFRKIKDNISVLLIYTIFNNKAFKITKTR